MKTIYIYVLDTLADWELGYVTAELNSRRFFKEDANQISIKTVSNSKQAISTMGRMTITPDCLIDDIIVSETSMLLLPGADTWNDPKHEAILVKASELLSAGATVCAICGATTALANFGILDNRPHTSNGPGFLEMVCSDYKGQDFYIDQPSIASNNLITAGSTAALLWTKQIIESLDVFKSNTLVSWYNYFNTGDSKYFFELMQTLPSNIKN
ncbi:type 1 glutamine amidotransferase family protein [Oceanobacillus jeddahense]|uniref:Glutamine amidotransferase n=1 Tax=Oceanobacillus jeddahense TaxID=1462527 RepID=A0ABY5K2H7_9BACI|nr:type 1 glutamine amidotransferase family protein [Oceanobacillus jeddahense]UUI04959.1 glutamine amidotransferase [Oceanobacillus jeddahense]